MKKYLKPEVKILNDIIIEKCEAGCGTPCCASSAFM
jgi:hypothetical protein